MIIDKEHRKKKIKDQVQFIKQKEEKEWREKQNQILNKNSEKTNKE